VLVTLELSQVTSRPSRLHTSGPSEVLMSPRLDLPTSLAYPDDLLHPPEFSSCSSMRPSAPRSIARGAKRSSNEMSPDVPVKRRHRKKDPFPTPSVSLPRNSPNESRLHVNAITQWATDLIRKQATLRTELGNAWKSEGDRGVGGVDQGAQGRAGIHIPKVGRAG